MAKQISLRHTDLFQVTLTVAVPNYGGAVAYSALDEVLAALEGADLTIIEFDEVAVALTAKTETHIAVAANKADTTLPDDEDSIAMLASMSQHPSVSEKPKPAKAKTTKRKKHKKAYVPTAAVRERIVKVYNCLKQLEVGSADDIAVCAEVPLKQTYAALYALHKDFKAVAAVKQHGLVRWSVTNFDWK